MLKSVLLLIMSFLQITKIIQGKMPNSTPVENKHLSCIHERPIIENPIPTEIDPEPKEEITIVI